MSNKFKNKMIMNKKSKNEENNNMYRSTNTKLPFADSNKLVINIGTLIVYYQSSSCEQKKGSSLDTQEDCIYGHFKPKRRNSIKPNRKKKSIKDNTKKGRPIKNIRLLCAINVFVSHHNYKTSNFIYRIIGECVSFMGLIEEDVIKSWQDKVKKKESGQYFYPLISYIKQMCVRARAIDIEQLPLLPF